MSSSPTASMPGAYPREQYTRCAGALPGDDAFGDIDGRPVDLDFVPGLLLRGGGGGGAHDACSSRPGTNSSTAACTPKRPECFLYRSSYAFGRPKFAASTLSLTRDARKTPDLPSSSSRTTFSGQSPHSSERQGDAKVDDPWPNAHSRHTHRRSCLSPGWAIRVRMSAARTLSRVLVAR